MSIKSFFGLVEIRTKVASVFPFIFGSLFALYRYNTFNVKNFLLMIVPLLCIDMATTGLNNYFDFKRAKKTHGYNYETHNAIVRDNLKEATVVATLIILLSTAVVFGVLLYLNTNIIVLLLGAMSFSVGVLYSFGPIPISRTPFGEILSGLFMGFVIPFIAAYIHISDRNVIGILIQKGTVNLNFNIVEVIFILMITIPFVSGIANIMLANNICDIEDDVENRRYTMPVYVGRKNALMVFKWLYYLAFIDILALVILRVIPLISALALVVFIPVNKNIKAFFEKQSKAKTFVLSVKNFVMISSAYILMLVLAMVFNYIVR